MVPFIQVAAFLNPTPSHYFSKSWYLLYKGHYTGCHYFPEVITFGKVGTISGTLYQCKYHNPQPHNGCDIELIALQMTLHIILDVLEAFGGVSNPTGNHWCSAITVVVRGGVRNTLMCKKIPPVMSTSVIYICRV